MFKKLLAIVAVAGNVFTCIAQDSNSVNSPLIVSGSVDAYYKYDLAKVPNIGTSFVSDQNSVSLGMIDVSAKKTTGKASFVGEVSFGPRGQYQSIPNADGSYDEGNGFNSFQIQNLFASYAFSDKFSMTAGYMGTFVGYEVISPSANFNYSTSYLFTNGPFQNAGIKANYAISEKIGLMAGLFNNRWNVYQADADQGVNTLGAQLSVIPARNWNAYINFLTGYSSGTIIDLTTAYQVTEKLKLGLNAADWSAGEGTEDTGYSGVAVYPQYSVFNNFILGLRAEYFKAKKGADMIGVSADESVTSLTVSGNLKSGGLTFIPEFRLDKQSSNSFLKENASLTSSASQFSFAVIYSF